MNSQLNFIKTTIDKKTKEVKNTRKPSGVFHATVIIAEKMKEIPNPNWAILEEARAIHAAEKTKSKETLKYQETLKYRQTFLEYLSGGLEIGVIFCVDFTGSNGSYSQRDSKHYLGDRNVLNHYEQVLLSVGNILAEYDKGILYIG